MRVKIRYNHNGNSSSGSSSKAKLLRFDDNVEYEELLRMIVKKLGIQLEHRYHQSSSGSVRPVLSDLFELTLGDSGSSDVVVEDTSEIDDGDYLVLTRRSNNEGAAHASGGDNAQQPQQQPDIVTSTKVGARVKREEGQNSKDGEDDNNSVEDVTEESLKRKRKKLAEDAICLSSDSSSEDEDHDDDGSVEEGSDGWEPSEAEDNDDDSDGDSDFEVESVSSPKRQRKQRNNKPKLPPVSPLEVIMDNKDVPAAPGGKAEEEEENNDNKNGGGMEEVSTIVDKAAGKKKADQAVKDRIIKLLNTGFHDKSNEHEAKNAMKLAQRLMSKHNLSQLVLLKEREVKNNEDQGGGEILKGGMVQVSIVNRKTQKPAVFARWIADLSVTVAKNFGVETYHTVRRSRKCSVTFYGIYTNAQLAGYAYRVATERIAQMTAAYQPPKSNTRTLFGFNNSGSTKTSRLSYSIGIVQGISDEVERNLRMEKERRRRKLERAKIAVSKGEAYEESEEEEEEKDSDDDDDDNDHDNDGSGFDIRSIGRGGEKNSEEEKPKTNNAPSVELGEDGKANKGRSSICGVDLEDRVKELEKEQQAAIVLVDHSEKIAEDVLKEQGIKLHKGRKRKRISLDYKSYEQGIEDSKEIDINQRAIKDEVKIKKEKKVKGERANR